MARGLRGYRKHIKQKLLSIKNKGGHNGKIHTKLQKSKTKKLVQNAKRRRENVDEYDKLTVQDILWLQSLYKLTNKRSNNGKYI